MIADLKPYPEYKESGSPWLGKVPGHWETRPAFGAFAPNYERNRGMKEKTVLSLSYGRIVIRPVEKLHGLVPESFETYQILNPGDIVLRTTDLQNDHTSLRVGMVRIRGIITSAYLGLRTKQGVIPDYGFQFLNVWDTSKAIYEYGSGLRQNLDFSHFKRMPVALPPPAEQAAIVRFLDWANGRLEEAIRAKRKVIALLNEQKQAIIHRAVTRGLDPNVPSKDSGIPWLGRIPRHWEVMPVKRCSSVISKGTTPSTEGRDTLEVGPIRFLKAENISGGLIVNNPLVFIDETTHNILRRSQLEQNDVLFVIAGATLGKTAIVHAEHLPANTNQAVAFVRPNRRVVPEFLALWLQSPRITEQISLPSHRRRIATHRIGKPS
jgi:type I restriction enzyme S subunit